MLELGRGRYRWAVIRGYLDVHQDDNQRVSGLKQAERRSSRCAVYLHGVSVREQFDELITVRPVLRDISKEDVQERNVEMLKILPFQSFAVDKWE